jgi:hypothetical protein
MPARVEPQSQDEEEDPESDDEDPESDEQLLESEDEDVSDHELSDQVLSEVDQVVWPVQSG